MSKRKKVLLKEKVPFRDRDLSLLETEMEFPDNIQPEKIKLPGTMVVKMSESIRKILR